jgi:predicted nucleotidyltransferase
MNPDDVYYLRQISRITGIGMGALQRELKLLAEGGIISRVVRGRQVFYQTNRTCAIFDELKSIVIKTVGVGDILKAALTPCVDLINVALIYGSFAAGKEKRGSDIDVLIVGEVSFEKIVSVFDGAQKTLGREINPVVYPVDEFRSKLVNDHHFLAAVVEEPVIFLIGDKSELERLAR